MSAASCWLAASSNMRHGPCFQLSRECRRHCGGVPKIPNSDEEQCTFDTPPPGYWLRNWSLEWREKRGGLYVQWIGNGRKVLLFHPAV